MEEFGQRLRDYMQTHIIQGEHLVFPHSCHSVAEAAKAAGVSPTDFVKNICLVDESDRLIVAIVKGEDRVSPSRIGKLLGMAPPVTATPEEILAKTGYPCGGVPSFGYPALFLIDPRVMDMTVVYTGGGSPNSLVRITPAELLRANGGQVARVRS